MSRREPKPAKRAAPAKSAGPAGPAWAAWLPLLLVLPVVALVRAPSGPFAVALGCWMAFASVACGLAYWVDKRRAEGGGWREPEFHLHALEALGGWPGAFVAQHTLRHKNAKTRYQVVFWTIVALHQLLALDALRGWALARWFVG